jgi:imidazole glycerol-phosphate synthase subunit HisH
VKKIVVIRYNAGNVRSVLFALGRIGIEGILSDDPAVIRSADAVIFPGVGEASSAMKYLKAKKLDEVILSLRQPVLGICLGMQLLCTGSEEGNVDCLGIFPEQVKKFSGSLKAPQVGWNRIRELKGDLFKGIDEGSHVYFVHGYYAGKGNGTISSTSYGLTYSSALQKENFFAVQFHPEKSSEAGSRILKNFIDLC